MTTDGQGIVIPYTGEINGRIVREAREYSLQVPESSPPEPDQRLALYLIGRIGAETGASLDLATASLIEYLRTPGPSGAPSHAAALWRLGMICEHTGDATTARARYLQALELDPDMEAPRVALDRRERDGAPGATYRPPPTPIMSHSAPCKY
jgi:hypothetical protein